MGTFSFPPEPPVSCQQEPFFGASLSWQMQVESLYRQPGLRGTAHSIARRVGIAASEQEDLCHDAFLILAKCLQEGRYNGKCTLRTYYFAIVKWQAIAQTRCERNKTSSLTHDIYNLPAEDLELQFLEKERNTLLEAALDRIGKRPGQLLCLAMQGHSMEEIAQNMGWKNANVAKKMAFQSRLKLKTFIRKEPELALALRA